MSKMDVGTKAQSPQLSNRASLNVSPEVWFAAVVPMSTNLKLVRG